MFAIPLGDPCVNLLASELFTENSLGQSIGENTLRLCCASEQSGDLRMAAGKPRALVADDEEIVRHTIGECLKVLGYEVELARGGQAALDFLGCGETLFSSI